MVVAETMAFIPNGVKYLKRFVVNISANKHVEKSSFIQHSANHG